MKVCSKCKIEKDESCFSQEKRNKSGKRSACKDCCNAEKKEWDRRNAGRKLMYDIKYREENRTKERVRNKKWRKKNSELISERKKKYYAENAEGIKERCRGWRRRNTHRILVYKERHKENAAARAKSLKYKERQKAWKKKNVDKQRLYCRIDSKKAVTELRDSYVKRKLVRKGYRREDIERVPDLIEIQKIKIINRRVNKLK